MGEREGKGDIVGADTVHTPQAVAHDCCRQRTQHYMKTAVEHDWYRHRTQYNKKIAVGIDW